MSRSLKKGPFIDQNLQQKVSRMNQSREKKVIRTWARASVIFPEMVGHTVAVHDGQKHAPIDVAKAIKSAAANAEHNFNLSRDELFVKQLLVDEGPTMKRIRPVSRGMAHQYFHRTCHITAVVEDRPNEER